MKYSKCGFEMERLPDDIGSQAIKKLGITYLGHWRCPNRINHKQRKGQYEH